MGLTFIENIPSAVIEEESVVYCSIRSISVGKHTESVFLLSSPYYGQVGILALLTEGELRIDEPGLRQSPQCIR